MSMANAVAPIPNMEMNKGVKKEFVEKLFEFDDTTASIIDHACNCVITCKQDRYAWSCIYGLEMGDNWSFCYGFLRVDTDTGGRSSGKKLVAIFKVKRSLLLFGKNRSR